MSNKYKHITIPKKLISTPSSKIKESHPFPQPKIELDVRKHRKHMSEYANNLKLIAAKNKANKNLKYDKEIAELEVKFKGIIDKRFLEKYSIDVYKKYDNFIVGKVSNKKISSKQINSDFEQLIADMQTYSEDRNLKSTFEKIEIISPLSLEDIVEENLKKYFAENPEEVIHIDVIIADEQKKAEEKIAAIKKEYREKFIMSVNSRLVHFCRVKAKFGDVKETIKRFNGIVDIHPSPLYELGYSSVSTDEKKVTIDNSQVGHMPIFIFDTPPNTDHHAIKGVVNNVGQDKQAHCHGTAVASLAVCGMSITGNSSNIVQQNSVNAIGIDEKNLNQLEAIVKETVEKEAKKHKLLIANLSINQYLSPYLRKSVSQLSVLLDELAYDYNCLFIISAGNIRELIEDKNFASECIRQGYPNYFNEAFCNILPPADSVNNISVGSIAFQQTIYSVAPLGHPAPFTRANIDGNFHKKPDFVHYDSNLRVKNGSFASENNGPTMAGIKNSEYVKAPGTSFTAPLITCGAGIIYNNYPDYKASTIKALLTHFSDPVATKQIQDKKLSSRLVGYGVPDIEKALYSLSSQATIVIEDSIGIDQQKSIKLPVPSCLEGSHKKRLKIDATLAYNSIVNKTDVEKYIPITLTAQIATPELKVLNPGSTRDRMTDAHLKSNIKKYDSIERSTNKNLGDMWEIIVTSQRIDKDFLPEDYIQDYSLVITIGDIQNDSSVDIHADIIQMIEVETEVEIPI